MDFDCYLRVHDNNQHNTAVKYCINLKRILNVAVREGTTSKSPLNSHKIVFKDTIQVYLTEQEVTAFEGVLLVKPKHILARDFFYFSVTRGWRIQIWQI